MEAAMLHRVFKTEGSHHTHMTDIQNNSVTSLLVHYVNVVVLQCHDYIENSTVQYSIRGLSVSRYHITARHKYLKKGMMQHLD